MKKPYILDEEYSLEVSEDLSEEILIDTNTECFSHAVMSNYISKILDNKFEMLNIFPNVLQTFYFMSSNSN